MCKRFICLHVDLGNTIKTNLCKTANHNAIVLKTIAHTKDNISEGDHDLTKIEYLQANIQK